MVARYLDPETLRHVGTYKAVALPRGRIVYRAGDADPALYVVLRGVVAFVANGGVVGRAAAGDFFGEMGCFAGAPRSIDAVVEEPDTVLITFDQHAAIELLRTSPAFALEVVRRLGERARAAEDQNRRLTAELRQRVTAA